MSTNVQKLKNGKCFVWMNLIGFEQTDDDCGAQRFIDNAGFVPDGVCALLFHPDFVHCHRGMDEEYTLFPDNCSYYAVVRNLERERQPWTNHDLRNLCINLEKKGCGVYAGLMGCTLESLFHREWIEDHPEILTHYRGGVRANHCLLKRFADGTYYEDFFIDSLSRTLKDYHMKGVHLADCFSPNGGNICHGDFSTDLTEQFMAMTGCVLDDDIASKLGDDTASVEDERADWIWNNLREEWIEFMCTRWEQFYTKLCDRVHNIGCEVMTLGMYCTDPFETKYCLGADMSRISRAGVDYITENILPTGCFVQGDHTDYNFVRYMSIIPTMAAHVRESHLVTMLGLYDATEEWDILHHAPCLHDADLYTEMAYRLETSRGSQRCSEGYFLCLGDGISHSDWLNETKKYEIAMSTDAEKTISAVMLWSEHSFDGFLKEYIRTRRWTPFKLYYELGNAGARLGGCIRAEDIETYSGAVVVADFDMLSSDEQMKVASYDRGPLVIVVPADFDMTPFGISAAAQIQDPYTSYPLKAYIINVDIDNEQMQNVQSLLAEDDGTADIADISCLKDGGNPLAETLPFVKVSRGFTESLAYLINNLHEDIRCDKPYLAYRLKDGNIRMYIFNTNREKYTRAFVEMRPMVNDVRIVSDFPLLPVRYVDKATNKLYYDYEAEPENRQSFEVKIAPGSVTIVDIVICGGRG